MLSPKTRVGDRVLIEAELLSLRQGGGSDGPEYYLVSVPGIPKPFPVLPDFLRSWEKANFLMTDLDFDASRDVLAKNIRNFRQRLNMSQEKLAEAVGVTQGAVALWESGRASPQYSRLAVVANALGVTVSSLIGETE